MSKTEDYSPQTLGELRYWRTLIVGIRQACLASLNHADEVLREIDAQIDLAKGRPDQPAKRCNFCGAKIVFRRVGQSWKAFDLDGTEHRCLEANAKA